MFTKQRKQTECHSWAVGILVIGRFRLEISPLRPAVLPEMFCGFPRPSRQMRGRYIKVGHCRFLSHTFQFIIDKSSCHLPCNCRQIHDRYRQWIQMTDQRTCAAAVTLKQVAYALVRWLRFCSDNVSGISAVCWPTHFIWPTAGKVETLWIRPWLYTVAKSEDGGFCSIGLHANCYVTLICW
jgi:hypothetical protein